MISLFELLERHPWCSKEVLSIYYNNNFAPIEESNFLSMEIMQIGTKTYYANKGESKLFAFGLQRMDVARLFVVQYFSEGFEQGHSPGQIAPMELIFENLYWRFWVDMGNIAVESLDFMRDRPKQYRNVKDVILTKGEVRKRQIENQIFYFWSSDQRIAVWDIEGFVSNLVKPKQTRHITDNFQLDPQFFEDQKRVVRNATSFLELAETYCQLWAEDFEGLILIGEHPFLTKAELALLYGQTSYQSQLKQKQAKEKMLYFNDLVERLTELKLIDVPFREKSYANRYRITAHGIKMLMLYWGTKSEYLQSFHPWPLKKEEDGTLAYSKNWLVKLGEHQALCRKFCLALSLRAGAVSNHAKQIHVQSQTMIGARILYLLQEEFENPILKKLLPDARLDLQIFEGKWNLTHESKPIEKHAYTLFIEIDRATNSLARLDEKLDAYAEAWEGLKRYDAKPLLVWLTLGSEYWQSEMIKAMRKRGLDGYLTTPERLFY